MFFLLIFIELWVNKKRNAGIYRMNDALTSLSLGVISQTKALVMFSLASIIYAWVSEMMALEQMSASSPFTWVVSFILYDFLYYWYHRTSHQINFLWASHVVHHQSEEYNLTTALRQTSSSVMVWIFYIPSFILGIPAEVFFVSGALNLVYQFWVHTQLVGKLGWFESIFVTPSHHRVHHGQNQTYIDKNHGGVFIIWDRFFGTFQEELDDEKVIYGVRRPVNSFNPIWANLHTWYSLLIDAIRTESWLDKFKIWFMPTGWRPADVEQQYPLHKQPAGEQIKYNPDSNERAKYYALFQYAMSVLFGVIFIVTSQQLDFQTQLLFWFVITLPLLSNGFMLEGRSFAWMFEGLRLTLTIASIFYFKSHLADELTIILGGYFIISIVAVGFIGFIKTKDKSVVA
jgi:alkylglycerol monooxygenase